MRHKHVQPYRVKVDLRVIAMMRYSAFPKALELKPQFCWNMKYYSTGYKHNNSQV